MKLKPNYDDIWFDETEKFPLDATCDERLDETKRLYGMTQISRCLDFDDLLFGTIMDKIKCDI